MKRSIWMRLVVMIFAFAFVISLAGLADAGRKTRDLVFEDEDETPAPAAKSDETPKESQSVVSVKATIELNRNGEVSQVLPSHEFQSGDKVKIVYTTNIDCFVYWLSEGSSGDHYMLFPNAKTGTNNWVEKNAENTIPLKGNFKFDDNKGTEKILLVMAPEKIPELEEASKQAAVKGGTVSSLQEKQDSGRKTRDLVFEEEDNDDSGVTTKSQASADIKQPFVVAFELVHN